ncbi:MAG: YcgN family cysteine cluster protein [Methylococcales bacterium]|nr:YcgN family cysteine cluster protein [Methylococcales bacterium]
MTHLTGQGESAHFWEKPLDELTETEWEALCDGCGKCCLTKLQDEDTGQLYYTRLVCKLIDLKTCRCSQYLQRTRLVPDCLDLKRENLAEIDFLPDTCAYRLRLNDQPLPTWHPLVSGDPNSVFDAGVSIRSFAMIESPEDDPEEHIIEWLADH